MEDRGERVIRGREMGIGGEVRTRQDKTRQDKTGQDRTGQDRIG